MNRLSDLWAPPSGGGDIDHGSHRTPRLNAARVVARQHGFNCDRGVRGEVGCRTTTAVAALPPGLTARLELVAEAFAGPLFLRGNRAGGA